MWLVFIPPEEFSFNLGSVIFLVIFVVDATLITTLLF